MPTLHSNVSLNPYQTLLQHPFPRVKFYSINVLALETIFKLLINTDYFFEKKRTESFTLFQGRAYPVGSDNHGQSVWDTKPNF